MDAQLAKYQKLRYFEFSLYNDTAEPSFTQCEINRLLDHLPEGIRECCIYTACDLKNINQYLSPHYTEKFEYLELGCKGIEQSININQFRNALVQNQADLL